MAAENKTAQARTILAPLPETKRGYGIFIDTHPKDKKLLYTSGAHVIIRSLEDPSQAEIFSEHKGVKVNVAKFSPNGEWIASGDDRGRVLVWGVKSKIVKNDVNACRKVLDISWSADGQRIIAAGDGNESMARVFAWDSSNAFGDISGHSKPILSCAFKPSRPFKIATASEDNLVCFHQGPPFKFQSSFKEHTRFPNCVRYNSDGTQFITVGADSKIYLFDGAEGTKIKEFAAADAHKGSIYSFSWSPDNKQIITASGDKTAKLWDVESGACVKTFTFGNNVEDMQVSTGWCGEHVLTVSLSGSINFLDLDNPNKPKNAFHGHQSPVLGLTADARSNSIFSSDALGQVAKWDLSGLVRAQWLAGKGHGGKSVGSLAVNSTSEVLYTNGFDDKLRLNPIKEGAFSDNAVALGGMPTGVATSATNPQLAVVSLSQNKILVLRGSNVVHTAALKFKPNCIALSHDDTEVAVGGDDKKVHVFSLAGDALTEKKVLSEHRDDIIAIAYSPNGRLLASSDIGRFLYIRDRTADFATKNPLGWQYHSAKVTSLSFSPDSNHLASGSQDQSIIIWNDLQEFEALKRSTLEYSHYESVTSVTWLDDKTIVSTGVDRAIKIWDVSGKL